MLFLEIFCVLGEINWHTFLFVKLTNKVPGNYRYQNSEILRIQIICFWCTCLQRWCFVSHVFKLLVLDGLYSYSKNPYKCMLSLALQYKKIKIHIFVYFAFISFSLIQFNFKSVRMRILFFICITFLSIWTIL